MGVEQLEPFKWSVVERQPSTIVQMLVDWLEAHQHYDFTNANFSVRRHFGVIAIVACIVAGLLLLTSVIFNTILVANIIRLRQLRISRIFLLQINVSVCDILRTCLLMPLTLVSIVSKDWVLGAELVRKMEILFGFMRKKFCISEILILNFKQCHILPMMQQMIPNICNLSLLILAYEHYRGVQHAVTGVGQSWRRAPVAAFVIGIWLLGFVSMLPFGQFSQFIDLADILSDKLHGVGLCVVAQNPRSFEIFRLLAIVGFVVPFIVSLYLYFRALTDERGMQMYEDKKTTEMFENTVDTEENDDEDEEELQQLHSADDETSLKDIRLKLTEPDQNQNQPVFQASVFPPVLPPATLMSPAINPAFIQQNMLKDFLSRDRGRSKSINVEALAAKNSLQLPGFAGGEGGTSPGGTVRSKSNNEIRSASIDEHNEDVPALQNVFLSERHTRGSRSGCDTVVNNHTHHHAHIKSNLHSSATTHKNSNSSKTDASANVSPSSRHRSPQARSPRSSNNAATLTKRHNRSSSLAVTAPAVNNNKRHHNSTDDRRSSHNVSPRSASNQRRSSSERKSSHEHPPHHQAQNNKRKSSLNPKSRTSDEHRQQREKLMQRRVTSASTTTYGACAHKTSLPRASLRPSDHLSVTAENNYNKNNNARLGPFDGVQEENDEDDAGDSVSQRNYDYEENLPPAPPLPITTTLRPYMRITLIHGFAQIPLNILVMVTALMAHHRLTMTTENSTNFFLSTTVAPAASSAVFTTPSSFPFRANNKHAAAHPTTTPRASGGELWSVISGPAASLVGNASSANIIEALFLLLFLLTMCSAIVGPWIVLRTIAQQLQQHQLYCYGYWLICFANKLAQLRRPSQVQLKAAHKRKQSTKSCNESVVMENRRKMTQIRLLS